MNSAVDKYLSLNVVQNGFQGDFFFRMFNFEKRCNLLNNCSYIYQADLSGLQTTAAVSTPSCASAQSVDVSTCSSVNASASLSSMLFTTCNAATVTAISPLGITYDTELTITGKEKIF